MDNLATKSSLIILDQVSIQSLLLDQKTKTKKKTIPTLRKDHIKLIKINLW